MVGANTSFHRLTPTESDENSNHIVQYPLSSDIPMEEIRRQNDVERWRNKLRLQEKFQVYQKFFNSKKISFYLAISW